MWHAQKYCAATLCSDAAAVWHPVEQWAIAAWLPVEQWAIDCAGREWATSYCPACLATAGQIMDNLHGAIA